MTEAVRDLRDAADYLDSLLSDVVTASTWHYDPLDGAVQIASADRSGYRLVAPGPDCEVEHGWPITADNQWMAALGPQAGKHLSSWLRNTADFEEWASNPLVCTPGPYLMNMLNASVGDAVEFARTVLASRPVKTSVDPNP